MSEAFARRYRLLERIAIGGTAEVFRAQLVTSDGTDRPVVIKRILPQFARDERFRRLFHEEACVSVTVSHPNIVRVLDHGDLGPTCYIALELVDGKDLGSLLAAARTESSRPTPPLAAFLAAQVADALQFIHDQKSSEGTPLQIIHRDVSPQNILVSFAGDVKLTDFGIAKSAIRMDHTVDGTLRGKLEYMAPEQAALAAVDHRADVFALGCVLCEMLCGAPPFRGDSEIETLDRVRQGRMSVELEALPVPDQLRQVLARALAPSRDERYQCAAHLARDLRSYLDGEPRPFTPVDLGRWVRGLAAIPEPPAASRVDEAVRRLLGDSLDDSFPGGNVTSVFAGQGSTPSEMAVDRPAVSGRGSRALQVALVLVGALGLCGWLLWAVIAFRGDSRRGVSPATGAPPAASAAGHAPGRDAGQPPARMTAPPAHDARLSQVSAGPSLLVQSAPSGAMVMVAGAPTGRTPVEIPQPSAPFVLELQKEGYRIWRKRVTPQPVGQVVRVVLSRATAAGTQSHLTINSLPWSRVRVDGKPVGNTPLVRYPVRAGSHRLELIGADGRVRKSLRVLLAPGAGQSFTFDLTSQK